jgi:hypothetical protein
MDGVISPFPWVTEIWICLHDEGELIGCSRSPSWETSIHWKSVDHTALVAPKAYTFPEREAFDASTNELL